MTGMVVLNPVGVTVQTSNVAEDDAALWASGTTYAEDDEVIYNHGVWVSLAGSNTGNTPSDGSLFWVLREATDRYKAFDDKTASQVENANTITYTLVPTGDASAIALLNISAATLDIVVTDTGSEIYNESFELIDGTAAVGWWAWTYGGVEYASDKIIDIPAFAGTEIDITIDAGTGTAKVGEILLGQMTDIGTPSSVDVSIEDYSVKDRDDFGNATIVERDFSFTHDFRFTFPREDARRVTRILASLRATPAVWAAALDNPEYSGIIFGYPETWNTPVESGPLVFASLRIEGLT